MPLLKIDTNALLESEAKTQLINSASKQVANMLGKPERYVMVKLECNPYMIFAGNSEPLVYAELKSLGLPEDKTRDYSASLTKLFAEEIQVDADRIYIEFKNAERHLWGWNGTTF